MMIYIFKQRYFIFESGVINLLLERQNHSSSSGDDDGWQREALTKELVAKGKNLPSCLVISVAMELSQPPIASK